MKLKMYKVLHNSLKMGKKGTYAGIAISLLYMLAYYGKEFDVLTFLYYLIVGSSIGFCIAAITTMTDTFVLIWFSRWSRSVSIIQMIATFLLSTAVFYGLINLFSKLLLGYYPEANVIFAASFWTGIASVFIALLYKYIEEKEEKHRIEKQYSELAVVEERKRLARDLHDSISQNLFGISLNLNIVDYMLDNDIARARELVDNLKGMVQEAQTEMRLMIYELRPLELNDQGFQEAVDNLAELYNARFGLNVICQFNGMADNLDNMVQLALYRVLQEAMNNIVRHAEATQVNIDVEIKDEKMTMSIIDNGKGFNPDNFDKAGHYGIKGMMERIRGIDGKFQIYASPGNGTKIIVTI